MTDLRIGHGIDIHRFGDGAGIVLGGIIVPCDRGIIAHSDGDVLLHALCDALLGAAALGDIGQHFPDSDPAYKNADSALLLAHVMELVGRKGWVVVNTDITILAQKPRISSYRLDIRSSVAKLLGISEDRVNIKATTPEKMGYIGREEGIEVQAVVLLSQKAGH